MRKLGGPAQLFQLCNAQSQGPMGGGGASQSFSVDLDPRSLFKRFKINTLKNLQRTQWNRNLNYSFSHKKELCNGQEQPFLPLPLLFLSHPPEFKHLFAQQNNKPSQGTDSTEN